MQVPSSFELSSQLWTNSSSQAKWILNSDTQTDLFKTAKEGNIDTIKTMISFNVNLNIRDDDGTTPLGWAVLNGHRDVIKLLLIAGADINMTNSKGQTPLMFSEFKDITEMLIEQKANINAQDNEEFTALMWAISSGFTEAAKTLIEKGGDVNLTNNIGKTALMMASAKGYKEIVELLLSYKADPNAQYSNKNYTVLWEAFINGHTEIAELLLKAGAKVDTLIDEKATLLFYSSQHGKKDFVELMLRYQAKINFQSKKGFTPIMAAAFCGQEDVVISLIRNKADLNIQNEGGHTAWTEAKFSGHTAIAKLIVEALDPIDLLWQKEILQIVSVGHSAHLKGTYLLQAPERTLSKVSIESANSPYWLRKMSCATQAFFSSLPNLLSTEEYRELQELLASGINALKGDQALIDRLENGLPLLLPVGYHGHATAVLLWNPLKQKQATNQGAFFVHCNRSNESGKPIEVYRYDPTTFNIDLLKKICDPIQAHQRSAAEYKKMFSEVLPAVLKFKPYGKFEQDLEGACLLKMQEVGNCSWACNEGIVWLFFAFKELFKDNDGDLEGLESLDSILNSIPIEQFNRIEKSHQFKAWLAFNQMYNLERYLGVRSLRPAEKVGTERKNGQIHRSLVSGALKRIEKNFFEAIGNEVITKLAIQRDLRQILAKSFSQKIAEFESNLPKQCISHLMEVLDNSSSQNIGEEQQLYPYINPMISELLSSRLYDQIKLVVNALVEENTRSSVLTLVVKDLLNKEDFANAKSFSSMLPEYSENRLLAMQMLLNYFVTKEMFIEATNLMSKEDDWIKEQLTLELFEILLYKDLQLALNLIDHMCDFTFNAIWRGVIKKGDFNLAERFLDRIPSKEKQKPLRDMLLSSKYLVEATEIISSFDYDSANENSDRNIDFQPLYEKTKIMINAVADEESNRSLKIIVGKLFTLRLWPAVLEFAAMLPVDSFKRSDIVSDLFRHYKEREMFVEAKNVIQHVSDHFSWRKVKMFDDLFDSFVSVNQIQEAFQLVSEMDDCFQILKYKQLYDRAIEKEGVLEAEHVLQKIPSEELRNLIKSLY